MSETWADAQFDLLEAAYNEIPIEAKARIEQLESLVRDMWFWGYEGHMDSESQDWQMKHIDGLLDRMAALGLLDGDVE